MAKLQSGEQKNNLELYLNDVFEKECEFKIEHEEVEFIQTGIETLVQEFVDKILLAVDSFVKQISNNQTEENERYESLKWTFFKGYFKNILFEDVFSTQNNCSLQRYVAENANCINSFKNNIIKVGSFYDGTKNNFPDEFDFIFLPLGLERLDLSLLSVFHFKEYVGEAINAYGKFLHYTSLCEKHQVTRNLDFEKFMGVHGPSFKVQFIYSNGFGEQRPVHVDLVPGVKIINSNTQQWFAEMVSKYVEPKTFREEILAAESGLLVKGQLAFTEIEQHFMKNILSKKHVKVYRILKHLLNGHGGSEECKKRFIFWGYTSYHIKTCMIYHHESCTNTDTDDLGPCCLQLLQELSKYEISFMFQSFNGTLTRVHNPCPFPYLKSTITTLKLMQTSKNRYNYERDKIKSISRQYLDRKKGRGIRVEKTFTRIDPFLQ